MNLAGTMIKDAFATFCTLENEIVESMQPAPSIFASISSLLDWKKLPTTSPTSAIDDSKAKLEEVKRYIQALKDCIAGSMYWIYETELFFGKKGGEVRSFGWVFAHMKYIDSGTLEAPGVRISST